MEKKIIQALFANACGRDELRPIMNGVHFEEERVYASDGHILVVYNEGSKKLDGKTIAPDGTELEGRYPNVDSVLPSSKSMGTEFKADLVQLKAACQYHVRKENSKAQDRVIIGGTGLVVTSLLRTLNAVLACEEPSKLKLFISEPLKPITFLGKKTKAILMPIPYEEKEVDVEQEEGCSNVFSYESFINDYVFNGWKKKPVKAALAWLD